MKGFLSIFLSLSLSLVLGVALPEVMTLYKIGLHELGLVQRRRYFIRSGGKEWLIF